jgi:hypothetical protein
MALLWIEGFEGFGTSVGNAPSPTGIVEQKWTTSTESLMDIETGRLGGYSLQFTGAATSLIKSGLTTNATMIVGMAVKFLVITDTYPFLRFLDGATSGCGVYVTPLGELAVKRGTTSLGITSGLGIVTDTWYYIEFKVVCNDTTGSFELRVGGVSVLDDSGIDTKAGTHTYHDGVQLRIVEGAGEDTWFDDFYCLDGSGATNNDFLGNMRVIAIRPDGDTAANGFTRSGGAENYDLVNEAPCDDDTSYVESGTSTTKDLYTYDAVSGLGDSIKGIQINTVCRETDANSFSLVTVAKLGTTESNSAAAVIGTTDYVTKTRLMETDPDGNAWTISNVDATQFGIKVN